MRTSMNPLASIDSAQVIAHNMIGNNAGNMLFSYSVMRTLLCEDVHIDTTPTYKEFTEREVDYINQTYECFVIPLANAFRASFKQELIYLTNLIRRLQIPCVVIGVGTQLKVDEKINRTFSFDEESRGFVKAVLEKSSMIGVRGEITAEYMKHLGFSEETDFTVIGCPSMYMHGDQLCLKEPEELTPASLVSVNRKIGISAKLHEFIVGSSEQFENYMYVPQGIEDCALLYAGRTISRKKYPNIHDSYPWNIEHPIYKNGHEIGFTNVQSWLAFLRERDFSFGTRIHGNIAAVLAGIPAYIFAPDARILELARYHNIQHMAAKDITDNTNIFELYEKADFYHVMDGHVERFHHYLDFLEMNGLSHVFGEQRVNLETPFDRVIAKKQFPKAVDPYSHASVMERGIRTAKYRGYQVTGKLSRMREEWKR